jgi:hypothetical protein
LALLKGISYPCTLQAELDGIKTLNPAWFQTGSQSRNLATAAAGVTSEFVPMRAKATDVVNINSLSPAPKALLSFDEPDVSTEADLLPIEALNAWLPNTTTTVPGLLLGSPATKDIRLVWNEQFVEAADALNMVPTSSESTETVGDTRVDFVACKIIGAPDAPGFLAKIDALHARIPNKNIWIVEAAVVDPSTTLTANSTLYTRAQVEQFMKDVWAGLKTRTFVERFAWKTTSNTDKQAWFSSLINSTGTSRSSTGVVFANLV